MNRLSDLIPLNMQEEKEKFFASNCTKNPQFIYRKQATTAELTKYGKPKLWYIFLAKRILKKHFQEKEAVAQIAKNRKFLDQDSIEDLITQRLRFYKLQNEYDVVFSKNFVSRIAVNNNEKIIKIRLPVSIDENEMEAILNHEIDTHVIRQLNYEKQPWFKKKKKNSFRPYLRTEEGLAALNELVASDYNLAYKSAANYLAVDLALKKDFVSVFNFFQAWQNEERAWTWTLKKKRGIEDTSKKGAFTKDLVYFEGFIQVLKYLRKNDCDPSELYYGKIDIKDINKVKKIGLAENIILPKVFMRDQKAYKEKVAKIIKNNLFLSLF